MSARALVLSDAGAQVVAQRDVEERSRILAVGGCGSLELGECLRRVIFEHRQVVLRATWPLWRPAYKPLPGLHRRNTRAGVQAHPGLNCACALPFSAACW